MYSIGGIIYKIINYSCAQNYTSNYLTSGYLATKPTKILRFYSLSWYDRTFQLCNSRNSLIILNSLSKLLKLLFIYLFIIIKCTVHCFVSQIYFQTTYSGYQKWKNHPVSNSVRLIIVVSKSQSSYKLNSVLFCFIEELSSTIHCLINRDQMISRDWSRRLQYPNDAHPVILSERKIQQGPQAWRSGTMV